MISSSPLPLSRFVEIDSDGNLKSLGSIEECLDAYREGRIVWLDFKNPTHQQLKDLSEPLGIHPLAIEDCFDNDQIPKIENYPSNTFILFNQYKYVDGDLIVSEVDLFLGERFIVTANLELHGTSHYVERLERSGFHASESPPKSADFLLHIILDSIVDEKLIAIEALQEEIDRVEEDVLDGPSDFNPEILMRLRRQLLNLRKSLFHEREILVKICRRDSVYITEKTIYHFRDIYDHLARFFEMTEMYREMISNLMEMYFSIQNNRMTLAANRTNQFVRRLTFITTIFMPLTLISGIGGMSEWTMITGQENWKISYLILVLLMVVIGFASYAILKRMEIVGENRE